MTLPTSASLRVVSHERILPSSFGSANASLPSSVPFDGQDLAMPRMNMHCSWFFHVHHKPHLSRLSLSTSAQRLRTGLAHFLAQFPAAAGQAKQDGGRWYLHYNASGADLILAECDKPLGDGWKGLGANVDPNLAPRGVVIQEEDEPVFAVKLTRFSCGSLCLSTSTHHWLVDFCGYLDLMDLLSRCIRDPLVQLPPRNWTRSAVGLVEATPPSAIPATQWFKERTEAARPTRMPGACRNALLLFTAEALERLKNDMGVWAAEAGAEKAPPHHWISTNDALHALFWSVITRVRGLEGETVTKLHTPLDGRPYVPLARAKDVEQHPPYVGNLHPAHVLASTAAEVAVGKEGLFGLAWRIRNDYLAATTPESMSAIIRYHNYVSPDDVAEGKEFGAGRMPNQNAMFGNDVTISNIAKLDFRRLLDFGEEVGGVPDSMGVLGIPPVVMGGLTIEAADGTALIVPAPETWTSGKAAVEEVAASWGPDGENGGDKGKGKPGMLVLVGLREQEYGAFLKDELIGEYGCLL
ncbi:hypothetical protein ACQY0O_000692 [Thecaphora frezii]